MMKILDKLYRKLILSYTDCFSSDEIKKVNPVRNGGVFLSKQSITTTMPSIFRRTGRHILYINDQWSIKILFKIVQK
jgi:hypothetical protein